MRLVICNSKKWFKLDQKILKQHEILPVRDTDELTVEMLREFDPDLVFFPHWNWVVSEEIFNCYRCIVFHTAPLPFGRGGSPIQNLILNGHSSTPVCAIEMKQKVDSGAIYLKEEISLAGPLWQIFERLNRAVNNLIITLTENLLEPVPQEGNVVEFKRLSIEDNELLPLLTLDEIYDRIRMVDAPSYPSAFINFGDHVIEFSDVTRDDDAIVGKMRIKSRN